jgi:hypothetical protein
VVPTNPNNWLRLGDLHQKSDDLDVLVRKFLVLLKKPSVDDVSNQNKTVVFGLLQKFEYLFGIASLGSDVQIRNN